MRHTTQALVIFLIFLWSLEEGVLSRRGQCAGNQCFAVFQESEDFPGAQKICKDFGGHLLTVQTLQAQEVVLNLLSGLSGRYWIGLQLPDGRCPDNASQLFGYRWVTGDGATDFHNWGGFDSGCSSKCVSVSAEVNSTWWQESCREKLTGFLCQHSLEGPCRRLEVKGGAQVKYTTPMGFDGTDLATFPQGSIAVKKHLDAEYLESKHLCFSGDWTQAPWSCEVMRGGCEHGCVTPNQQSDTCTCPTGQALHANNITCAKDPCADCAHQCQQEGDIYVCRCNHGYTLSSDRKGCVDVNECDNEDSCTEENQECMNTVGGFECICREGFDEEDGVCVDIEICEKCEHMLCEKSDRVYKCACRSGFTVSDRDPTNCDIHCTQQDCPAQCIPDTDKLQCYCANGYIQDIRNETEVICTDIDECEDERHCDHTCVNTYGSYRCLCDEGFELLGDHQCVSSEDGSGSTQPYQVSTPAAVHPTAVPSYVKAGSLLGIAVFVAVCAALLYFLVRNALKRCGKMDLASLKGADVDIFHLQQVTTEKYKRFSFDKQWKNDSQRL
uniref:thrombomodulin-like n=1 Tax=Centroberyx gerrardi TaxID=166262 RepID=UPI003AAA5B14